MSSHRGWSPPIEAYVLPLRLRLQVNQCGPSSDVWYHWTAMAACMADVLPLGMVSSHWGCGFMSQYVPWRSQRSAAVSVAGCSPPVQATAAWRMRPGSQTRGKCGVTPVEEIVFFTCKNMTDWLRDGLTVHRFIWWRIIGFSVANWAIYRAAGDADRSATRPYIVIVNICQKNNNLKTWFF